MSTQSPNPHDDQPVKSSADEALIERLLTDAPDSAAPDRSDSDSMEATIAALALSVPPRRATAGDPVRARLLARASADASRTTTPSSSEAPSSVATSPVSAPSLRVDRGGAAASSSRSTTAWWLASLATLATAASLLFVLRLQTERSALRLAVATLENAQRAGQLQLDSLTVALGERDAQLASVTGPDVAVVELASTGSLPPAGRMFWDRATAQWTFVANNMPELEAGRTYALWLLTADARILAGYFAPDARGVAVVRATYDLPRTALSAVAVTEEPDIGVDQPTGAIVLVGSAGSAPE